MDHTANVSGFFLLQEVEGILSGLPAVNDHRQTHFLCQLQLTAKPLLLYLMSRNVPIIVQTDLTDRHHLLFLPGSLFQPFQTFFTQLIDMVRMNAYRRIDMGISARHFHALSAALQGRPHIGHRFHAVLRQGSQKRFSVLIKSVIIVMCMCIKNHSSSPFSGKSSCRQVYHTCFPFAIADFSGSTVVH